MTEDQLLKKFEKLEALNENLRVEIQTMNNLLIGIGFPQGLNSLKDVAKDVINGNGTLGALEE